MADQGNDEQCRCAMRRSFLKQHPVICFLIGCTLIGISHAGCSMAEYYDALATQVTRHTIYGGTDNGR